MDEAENDTQIEELLRNAPAPATPAGLWERLEKNIDVANSSSNIVRPRSFKIRYLLPVASLAASLIVLACLIFWPASTAYSFQKTVEAIRSANVKSVHLITRFRSGPSHPVVFERGGTGSTSYHPANPLVSGEIFRKISNGREMSYTVGNNREQIYNAPLGLTTNLQTGERKFFLVGSGSAAETDHWNPEELILELADKAERGEIRYEVEDEGDLDGNLRIAVWYPAFGDDEFMRFWVNAENYLPVRMQMISTEFPEFGKEVVMQEYELVDYGIDFEDDLFDIEPTDAELEKFGLVREELSDLPPNMTSIEIGGDDGVRFTAIVKDDSGTREISGAFPVILLETPKGRMTIDLRLESGQLETVRVQLGGGDFMTLAERVIISLTEDGSERGISAVQLDAIRSD